MAAIALASPVCVSLTPISYGFPVMTTNNLNTAYNTASVNAFDVESASVNFPQVATSYGWDSSGVTPMATSSCAFPTLCQSGVTGQMTTQEEFAQSTQFSSFSYPAIGVGTSGLSGFWGF